MSKQDTKQYYVVRSAMGNLLVRHSSVIEPNDRRVEGPFDYLEACEVRDNHQSKSLRQATLQDLIKALDKFTESEIIRVLRGDENVGIRREVKGLATKLASAAIQTGMEAAKFKPVPTKKESV